MVLLLWIFNVFVLSCVCYVFVRVCLYVLCGHLLGKGWPLGSRLWCLLWVCHCYLVSWVRCGTWLYRFLIFAPLLTFISNQKEEFISTLRVILYRPSHNGRRYNFAIMFFIWSWNSKKSKWIWLGNVTIAHCRPTHCTARKSHRSLTVTRHQEDN